jgi:PAS domain S-box-containing protein
MYTIDFNSWYGLIVAAGAGLSALVAIWKAVAFLRAKILVVTEGVESFVTFPDDAEVTFKALAASIEEIAQELRTNGGSTLKDAINRIEKTQAFTLTRQRALLDSHGLAIFETDEEGDCTHANQFYLDAVGRGMPEVAGKGWISCIAPEDRERVATEWYRAVSDNRMFNGKYSFVASDGTTFMSVVSAHPVKNNSNKIIGYVGMMIPVGDIPNG